MKQFFVILCLLWSSFVGADELDLKIGVIKELYELTPKECGDIRFNDASDDEVHLGKLLFESKVLSGNDDIACINCHLDEFNITDGLPLAIGVNGIGDGMEAQGFACPPKPHSDATFEQNHNSEMTASALLNVEHLSMHFGGLVAVDDLSFCAAQGEITGIIGPNGAGKTTTFRMCMGMVPPDKGKIVFRNREITRWPIYKRARLGMGYLAQEPSVFRKLSVIDNLLAILELGLLPANEQKQRAESLLHEFGLDHVRQSQGEVLSGGERRRLEIARALASNPSLILLDEPFSGIDPVAVEEIQGILESLKDRGISILLTDHNVRETLFITDRTYILAAGNILAEGKAEDLAADKRVREIYLGKRFELA